MSATTTTLKKYREQDILKKSYPYITILALSSIYILLTYNYVNNHICTTRYSFAFISVLYAVIALLLCFWRQWKGKAAKLLSFKYSNEVLFFLVPLCAFYIDEIIYNPNFLEMRFDKILINYMIILGMELGVFLVCHNFKTAYISVLTFSWIYGVVNFYVLKFKGNPLLPSDLLSYKTAMKVAANYSFDLADSIVSGTLLFLVAVCVVLYLPCRKKKISLKQAAIMTAMGLTEISLIFAVALNVPWAGMLKIGLNMWEPKENYFENGGILTFIIEAQAMETEQPDNYSEEMAHTVLDSYSEKQESSISTSVAPSVIVIMNESFSDLSMIGEFESDEYLTNMKNMTQYVMKGNAYASVLGGGTCNSEFEFLTGNSMANFEGTVYPYQMFDLKGIPTLAAAFGEAGYETVAMHPYNGSNWNRERVYEQFGFQDFISKEDMKGMMTFGNYASDTYNYQQIIEAYENKEGPLFLFNITMQNHGGYEYDLNQADMVYIEGKYREYQDVVNYLTLVRESDRAFAELVAYFSNVEEPVIICMFGDHQPELDEKFISEICDSDSEEVAERQKRFVTPYVIWSNYDTGVKNVTKDMSLNYLGAQVLELVGVESEYFEFLSDLQNSLPIINTVGYMDFEGEWQKNTTPNTNVDIYRILQYYVLFDGNKSEGD